MIDFTPVHLSKPLERRASQTFLRHMSRCPRSAYLYAENRGEAQNDAMVRGTAFHAVAERAIKLAIENGEPMIPPELVRDVLTEVLAEAPVPWHEQDFLREMVWRWASDFTLDPANVIACETLYVLDVGGWEVRAKVDFAELREQTLHVNDWKTGRGAVSLDDVSRKRSNGTFLPRTFQLCLYALAIKYGKPVVDTVECRACDGKGSADEDAHNYCPFCRGRHVVDAVAGFSRGARAQDVTAEFTYPAVENAEGKMLRRTMGLTALELSESLESLRALIDRLAASERTGDWPAIVSTPGCSECPAPSECPIPARLRDHNGEVTSVEQAAELLEAADVQSRETAAIRRSVKAFAKEHDVEIRFGADKVAKFVYSKTERIDKEALRDALEKGTRRSDGDPWSYTDFVSLSESTLFKDVKIDSEEDA
jgi:hypothetical protein